MIVLEYFDKTDLADFAEERGLGRRSDGSRAFGALFNNKSGLGVSGFAVGVRSAA